MTGTKDFILSKLKSRVDFQNSRRMMNVVSDTMQLVGTTDKEVALKCNLSKSTVARMRTLDPTPTGKPYNPHISTLEAILEQADAVIEIRKR